MDKLNTQKYSFELNSQLSELKALNQHLIAFGRNCGLPDLILSEVNICLDELFTNIVSYGFNDDLEHKIRFSMEVDNGILIATMEDDGVPFNPLEKEAVELPEDVDSAKIGGLGIHITKELVNEVSYERKGRLNRLTLKKSIPAIEDPMPQWSETVKYNHVLALYPYFKDSTATMGIFPPTGLEYIATNIKDHVGKVTLLDLRYEKQYQDVKVLSEFIKNEIDLVCISITWNSQFNPICDLINQLPEDVTTVIGGYKATEEVEYLFERCLNIDIIVRGEGEDTIREVVNGLDCNDILGLSYRKNGTVTHNDPRPLPDISAAAFPDRSIRRHEYHWIQSGARITNLTFDTVLTSRGCPYNCKFCTCSLNPLGQKRQYAERPLDSVIDELKSITADVVMFSDDNFFTNPKRSKQLCDLIIQNGIKKRFCVQTRIEIGRDAELLEKAEKAGFKLFLVGIESPHDKILKQLSKGITQKQTRDAFKTLNKYNFFIHGYFIYGNIGETEEEMVYIAPFAKELKLETISFQKLRIEKYSPLKEIVENTPGYYFKRIGGAVYSDQHDRRDFKRIRNRIRSDFYDFQQIRQILQKVHKSGLLTNSELMQILTRLPNILFRLLKRQVKKKVSQDR